MCMLVAARHSAAYFFLRGHKTPQGDQIPFLPSQHSSFESCKATNYVQTNYVRTPNVILMGDWNELVNFSVVGFAQITVLVPLVFGQLLASNQGSLAVC